jgi:hypothetical protein
VPPPAGTACDTRWWCRKLFAKLSSYKLLLPLLPPLLLLLLLPSGSLLASMSW